MLEDERRPPSHLVPLADGWAVWRAVGLRGAGLPVGWLSPFADPEVTAAADRVVAQPGSAQAVAAYTDEFARAVGRLTRALREAATRPAFREAVAWQNRHALTTGVDPLLRHDPAYGRRTSKHKDHEALVARYLQRYCAKNDTIGFFGPVGWAELDAGSGIRVTPGAPLARRTVHLEGWAVAGVMAPHAEALRPWLPPRRMPFVAVEGTTLRVPLAPPVPLSTAAAAVLRACDGRRTAGEVAAFLGAGPAEVFATLADLHARGRLAWQVEAAPEDTAPERTMRELLVRVDDDAVRRAALAALDELIAARDALAGAAGDAARVAAAMAGLESTFTRLSGAAPTRRAGQLYAGRTVAYEECLRGTTVHIGTSTLEGLGPALALVLDSARWFTSATAALVRRAFADAYQRRVQELGAGAVPFADIWLLASGVVLSPPPQLVATLVRTLHRRWAEVLRLPEGERRVELAAAELRPRARAAFPPGPPGWPTAVHHSPDLMRAGDRWVLGELHAGVNTLRYHAMVTHHAEPEKLRAAMAADLRRGVVHPAQSIEGGGLPARLGNALANPQDHFFVYARDSCGHDPERSVPLAECELVDSPGGLRVRRRGGGLDVDLMDVLGDIVAGTLVQHFSMFAPARHTPRVTIDALVVHRESWTFPADELEFATVRDEAARFVAARAWAARHGLPRHVFVRGTGERKPMYADLTSLASVDLVARAVRGATRAAGDGAQVRVAEMMPAPEQLWLSDEAGERYTAELRVVAVDRSAAAT